MKKIHKTIFQLRRDTSSEWNKYNPILRVGEPGYAYDTNVFKIGDGINHWNDLPVQGNSISEEILSRLEALENGASLPNSELLSTITKEMIYSWDSSETNAKKYADSLFANVDTLPIQKIEQLEQDMKAMVTEDRVLEIVNEVASKDEEIIKF